MWPCVGRPVSVTIRTHASSRVKTLHFESLPRAPPPHVTHTRGHVRTRPGSGTRQRSAGSRYLPVTTVHTTTVTRHATRHDDSQVASASPSTRPRMCGASERNENRTRKMPLALRAHRARPRRLDVASQPPLEFSRGACPSCSLGALGPSLGIGLLGGGRRVVRHAERRELQRRDAVVERLG